jgi:hypothetical protein
MSTKDAIEHLVGMQAQVPTDPYIGLWTRLEGFRTEDLAKLITERRAIRIGLMRGTVHLVTARDGLAMRAVVQQVYERVFLTARGDVGVPTFTSRLAGIDLKALLAAGRKLLDVSPRTAAELRPLLNKRWPDRDADALAAAVHFLLPLVQVPPRGLWGQSGQARHASLETWLGKDLGGDASPDKLIVRYLRAFGRPRLRTFRDERGRELFDVLDGALPDPETPAPPRFLPEYDNVFLSHDDRSRIASEDFRLSRSSSIHGTFGTVLVDGFIAAIWKIRRSGHEALLRIESTAPLGRRDMDAVAAEGERLLAFTDPDASRAVSVANATKSSATSRRTHVANGASRETVRRRTKKES